MSHGAPEGSSQETLLSAQAANEETVGLGLQAAGLPEQVEAPQDASDSSSASALDRLRRRQARPRRSILKQHSAAGASRFNLRDILQPINSRFALPDAGPLSPPTDAAPASFSWRNALGRWTGPSTATSPRLQSHAPDAKAAQNGGSHAVPALPASTAPSSASSLLSVAPLKGVTFTMSNLAVVYPINATGSLPPADEAATRQRIESEHRRLLLERKRLPNVIKDAPAGPSEGGWTGAELERLYDECCRTREVFGLQAVRAALQDSLTSPPRTLNLAHQNLSRDAALALSDLLSVDWGLRKLVLEDANLDDESLKPIIRALLVSASLPTLSLANNKRIRAKGWRLIAVLISKAPRLAFLDLSDNALDKRTVEWLLQGVTGDQASAKDADDRVTVGVSPDRDGYRSPLFEERLDAFMPRAPLLRSGSSRQREGVLSSLKLDNCGLRNQALEVLAHGVRTSGIKHVSLRRNRVTPLGAVALAVMMRDYAVAGEAQQGSSLFQSVATASSAAEPQLGGQDALTVTAKDEPRPRSLQPNGHAPASHDSNGTDEDLAFEGEHGSLLGGGWRPESVRTKLQKQIDTLPRIGSLLTLDIKNNEIKGGVVYIAQVLKRNKTLRVLNLSDNKIEPSGLAAVAEALRYNTTLETLDLGRNPCAGPSLEGILALRTAFSHNTTLLRVFLNSTGLGSDGAISLAEYLPEMSGLIHCDLTENYEIDIAGAMALSAAVKLNHTVRCLDLNIPPNDPDFARLSQDILQSCIRNTEAAQEVALASGSKHPVSAPIHTSAVARNLEEAQASRRGRPRSTSTVGTLLGAAQSTRDLLLELVSAAEERQRSGGPVGAEALMDVESEARVCRTQILEALPAIKPTDRRDRLSLLQSELSDLADRARLLSKGGTPLSTPLKPKPPTVATLLDSPNALPEVASPSFSITDSDDDDEETDSDESAAGSIARTVRPEQIVMPPREMTGWAALAGPAQSPRSPVEQHSRILTLEEGEVFRRKMLLDARGGLDARAEDSSGSDDGEERPDERDVSGEELRQEILQAEVPEAQKTSPRLLPASPELPEQQREHDEEPVI